ncbi:uncharacterized protein N7506_000307 [Penicillium brevicompactum]|uniref:uncharacterized protein n=1 Tax=Penicillium brevicompactum TaxID=5074 RepID=UPI0025414E89|nr:uncharacterized protein N7506_000307 [Penicillium brevicompactum]KAJ5347054.1 hypothetical protein N7506_000307 [Penicillium brevicompactum]
MDLPISDAPVVRETSPAKELYQLFLSVHHRGELSLGDNRKRLGFSAYHWAILLAPENAEHHRCYAFDTTNGVSPHSHQRVNMNPDYNWAFRVKSNVNPASSDSLLIRIAIGDPHDVHPNTIRTLLQSVQLPIRGAWPPQNCVDWTKSALHMLWSVGHAANIDSVDMMMARALAYADLRMADPASAPFKLDHMGNEM